MSMDLQATENEFGSPVKFYRFQTEYSGTTYDSVFGFLAGDPDHDHFPSLDCDDQRSIVEDHSLWSYKKPSPFISTTSDLSWAQKAAKGIICTDPIYIAEISPGRAVSGSMRYYHWDTLVCELGATIEFKATNYHETVFLGNIPQEAITWYGTVEESERHCFEEEDKEEDDEEEQDEEEQELLHSLLISIIRLELGRADGQDSEESEEEEELENEERTEYEYEEDGRLEADLIGDLYHEQYHIAEFAEEEDLQVNRYGCLYHEGVWGDDDGALCDDEDDEDEEKDIQDPLEYMWEDF